MGRSNGGRDDVMRMVKSPVLIKSVEELMVGGRERDRQEDKERVLM